MTDKHWNRNAGRVSSELFGGQKSSSWWNLFSVRQDSMNQRSHLIQLPHSELNPSVHGNLVPQFFTSRSTAGPQSILITGSTAVSRPVVILIQATCCSIPGVTPGLSKYWGSRSTGNYLRKFARTEEYASQEWPRLIPSGGERASSISRRRSESGQFVRKFRWIWPPTSQQQRWTIAHLDRPKYHWERQWIWPRSRA